MTREGEESAQARARRVAALFLVSLCAVLMSHARVFAQVDPTGTGVGPLMCYYGPGQYMPCGSTTPPQGPDPFQWSQSRYESVRARLRAFGVVTGEGQPPARTPEELSRQADALFVGTAYKLDTLAFKSDQKLKDTEMYESDILFKNTRESELQKRAEAMPAALHDASEKLTRELAKAEAQEKVIASVERFTDRMHARADRAAWETFQWLSVASPPGALLVSEKMVSERKTSAREPLREPFEIPNLRARDSDRPIITVDRPPGLRDAPRGTVDEKISAIEGLIDRFGIVMWEFRQRERRFAEVKAEWQRKATRVKSLEAVVGGDERRLEAVEDSYRKAQGRNSDAVSNGFRAGANAGGAIVETYVLEKFRDETVIPAVKRFLRVNGIARDVDRNLIVQLYEMRKSALPSARDWVGINRLIEVEKRALEILPDFMAGIIAAGRTLGTTGDERGEALYAEMQAETGDTGRELVEKANGVSSPFYKILRSIVNHQ